MQVTFFRHCVMNNGAPYESNLMSVDYPERSGSSAIVADAKATFEEHMSVDSWQELAHDYRIS